MNMELKIDPEFEKVCPPLTNDEFEQLKDNILEEGIVYMPLITWEGLIVDGHHRHKIIRENPTVEFTVRKKTFSNRYEAISWICKNQLGRRNLTARDKDYLIGKRYEAEKMAHGASDGFRGNQYEEVVTGKICPLPKEDSHITRERIAQETGTSERHVGYAEQFAKGVDAAEDVFPGIKHEILSGSIKPTRPEVIAIAKAPLEKRQQMAEDLRLSQPKKKSRKAQHDIYQSIDAISEELARPKEGNNIEHVLGIIKGAADNFEEITDFYIGEFPELLDKSRHKLIDTVSCLKSYIIELCEGESI